MAQHINIDNFTEERFKEIKRIVTNDFNRSQGLLRTSFKYQYIYSENDEDIYTVEKRIPNDIIYSSDRGTFEIHWNTSKKQISNIYLVA